MVEGDWSIGTEGKVNIPQYCENCELFDECEVLKMPMEELARSIGRQNPREEDEPKIRVKATEVHIINGGKRSADEKRQYSVNSTRPNREKLDICTFNCPMNYSGVEQKACGTRMVKDGIGDHYQIELERVLKDCVERWCIKKNSKNRWEPRQPVVISAQTGRGKNYFVEKCLIPYVRDLNYQHQISYKILIVSNRRALKLQIQKRLQNVESEEGSNRIISECAEVDVITYQALLYQRAHFKKTGEQYLFVICDEAHFFTSDATFNPYTEEILRLLVEYFHKSIRIYMTATPYEVLPYIIRYEEKYCELRNKRYMRPILYHFKRDYNYLDIRVYECWDELLGIISRSAFKGQEKWLIFMDDKKRIGGMKTQLEEAGKKLGFPFVTDGKENRIFTVDATSKDDAQYLSLIERESLGKNIDVLISTSVLDNGVNFNDVSNIVVADMSIVKTIQMVGRARHQCSADTKKVLYLRRFDEKYVHRRIEDLMSQRSAYHDYELAYGSDECYGSRSIDAEYNFLHKFYEGNQQDWERAKHLFYRDRLEPTKMKFNKIAKELVEKKLEVYNSVEDAMHRERELEEHEKEMEGEIRRVGQTYLEFQMAWFGKEYSDRNDVSKMSMKQQRNKLIDFLNRYVEKEIQTEEQDTFSKQFTELYDAAYGRADKNRDRNYGKAKINRLCKECKMPFHLEGEKGSWKLAKTDENSADF